ncbi:hypothetical protein H920_01028 [Fukomys damarensis]|uniref:Uncharacterized protein n=1 Tax=Fukomys damarensis TaxID=885580 RepID=A0A091E496_FUKDA|nr:hypothetical protein H920_01028 [Fukomys damarensis]
MIFGTDNNRFVFEFTELHSSPFQSAPLRLTGKTAGTVWRLLSVLSLSCLVQSPAPLRGREQQLRGGRIRTLPICAVRTSSHPSGGPGTTASGPAVHREAHQASASDSRHRLSSSCSKVRLTAEQEKQANQNQQIVWLL